MPLYSYTTAGSSVIRSLMLLSIVSVFSTLMGASVAAWVGASVAGAWVGASVAGGLAGASVAVAAWPPHAVSIRSAREMKIVAILRFEWYISSSSRKVVWELIKKLI